MPELGESEVRVWKKNGKSVLDKEIEICFVLFLNAVIGLLKHKDARREE